MEVSAKTLREVEFREKMRGYHPEDVDHFLEQVAEGIEVLHDRLRQAVERAQKAEAAAVDAGGSDDTIRKTLVLAQRTADMAVQEAREQAARVLGSAEQQAQAILADAEERGRRAHEEAIAEAEEDLARLDSARTLAQQEVDNLQRWISENKAHLQVTLSEALAAVERTGVLWPAPSQGARSDAVYAPPAVPVAAQPPRPESAEYGIEYTAESSDDPDTILWSPDDEELPTRGASPSDRDAPTKVMSSRSEPARGSMASSFDEQALDDFFDDNDEFAEDRRLGGRLRRRR